MAHAAPDPSPSIFTVTYWADVVERVVSAAGGGALVAIPVSVPYAHEIDWRAVLVGAGMGALAEFCRCLAAAGKGNPGTASMLRATQSGVAPKLAARFVGRGQ
nr:hypothetical protein [Mycobacterium sp. UM_NZ2]